MTTKSTKKHRPPPKPSSKKAVVITTSGITPVGINISERYRRSSKKKPGKK